MISIRKIVSSDIESAIQLTDTVEWGFSEEDFAFMMELEPDGCFVAFAASKFIGLTITVSFENIGWIGNVIVNSDYRDQGIGSLLIKYALSYLVKKGVNTIGLYSYVDAVPFYERLGFKRDKNFIYLVGSGIGHCDIKTVKPIREENFQKALELDKQCFGVSREKLLRRIFSGNRNFCYSISESDNLVGFIMARVSSPVVEIGPLISLKGLESKAIDLLNALLRKFIGFKVYIGLPEDTTTLISILKEWKFSEKFKVVRMYYGPRPKDSGCMLAIESLERG
ncbi:MAG: GNAT family N-acetyltransferase [Candidatus Bathyarchaeota archaeon]